MGENDIAEFALDDNTIIDTDKGLAVQDISKLDIDKLNVETFEVMSRQATVNIGTIGHVAHGKSTVVKALSGVKTQKYHREAVMNITIHLGYANAKVYQCERCPRPLCYQTYPSSQPDSTPCPTCGTTMVLKRHFSFVDCPGHDVLMATMLNGAAIMDAALLLIAANETFPQPQTLEHLAAAEMMSVPHVIFVQNKIDLVTRQHAAAQYDIIHHFVAANTAYGFSPIIPVSAQLQLNVDFLLEYLVHIPLPRRRLRCIPQMHVLRSFDVSLPSVNRLDHLHGGVVGGSLEQGILKEGDTVEFFPGMICLPRRNGSIPTRESVLRGLDYSYLSAPPPGMGLYCLPIRTRVCSLMTERNKLQFAMPGGLIAVGTQLDPALTRQNKLRGQVMRVVARASASGGGGAGGGGPSLSTSHEPATIGNGDVSGIDSSYSENTEEEDAVHVYQEVDIQFYLLKELLGLARTHHVAAAATSSGSSGAGGGVGEYRVHPAHTRSAHTRVRPLYEGESIVINIGTLSSAATVVRTAKHAGRAVCRLESPVCGRPGDRVVLARYVERKVRIMGWGSIKRGVTVPLLTK